jgi:acetyl-CoA carboxylase alpha subunit
VGEAIERHLREILELNVEERRERRYRKFRGLGAIELNARP